MKKLLLLFSVLLVTIGLKAESIVPEPDSTLPEIPANIVFTFDVSVTPSYVGIGTDPRNMVELTESFTTPSTTFTVPVPESLKESIMSTGAFAVSFQGEPGISIFASYYVDVPHNTYVCGSSIPAAGSTVDKLETITLVFDQIKISGFGGGEVTVCPGGFDANKTIQLFDGNNQSVAVGTPALGSSIGDPNVTVTLDKKVTEPGTYRLVIPEGTVYDEGYYEGDPDLGVANGATYNPAIEYTYTVAAPATVESIVPEANTEITEIGNFVFTFSDDVTVESAKIQLGPGNIQDVPARLIMTKGKVATIDLSALAEDLKSNGRFNIILKVKDSKGLYITYGTVESYVSAGYTVSTEIVRNTFEPLEVEPAKESTVESLKVVQLTFIDKLNRLGSFVGAVDLTKKAQLLDSNNNKVADGILAEVQLDPTDFLPGAVSVTLDSEITKDGEYTLVIPEQAIYNAEANPDDPDFGIANEMDPGAIIYNPELKYTYTVSSPVTFTTNPENESSLDEIPANVVFTFNKEVTITEAYLVLGRGNSTDITESITTKIGTEITVPVPADKRDQILENRFFTISLNGENDLSAQATYNMIVPMNILELQKAAPADNSTVESLSTITLTYGVAGTSMIDPGTPISGIDASKKEVQLLNADKTVAATGIISVVDELDILVTLNQTITKEGTYTLTIPEATVYDGNADIADWDNSYVDVESEFTKQATYNPEITLTYKILASGINVIQAALTGEVSVYSVQGILLRKGDASVVLNDLAEGIYIVNGQKMAISK